MTVHVCVEPSSENTSGWIKVAGADDTLKFPGVDSCLAMAFLMANGAMVGTHTGVFWYGKDLMGNDCAGEMLKTMLNRLTVYDGRIDRFLLFTDIPAEGEHFGGDYFHFDLDALTDTVEAKRPEQIDMCRFNKTSGAIDIELNGRASLLTVRRKNRAVLSMNFGKISAGTHDIPA